MQVKAELKKTSQRKSQSSDNIYQLVFETDNPQVMDLGKLPSDTLFNLEIGINEK
jgi:hypothetical protein